GSPLKTIGAGAAMAVANNQAGIGTKVIIRPGIYREAVSLSFSGKDTSMPITFQASTPAKTVMSGADVWDGWTPTNGSPVYTHAWPYGWGLCPLDTGTSSDGTFHTDDGIAPPEEDVVRRREMIFVGGKLMTQVMTSTALRVGTFFVDESK